MGCKCSIKSQKEEEIIKEEKKKGNLNKPDSDISKIKNKDKDNKNDISNANLKNQKGSYITSKINIKKKKRKKYTLLNHIQM